MRQIFEVRYQRICDGQESQQVKEINALSSDEALAQFLYAYPGIPKERIVEIKVKTAPSKLANRWKTQKNVQFFYECFQYIQTEGALLEPSGADGKQAHARWREVHGFSFIDPVKSNLSTWTSALKYRGYIYQRPDGLWECTNKPWQE